MAATKVQRNAKKTKPSKRESPAAKARVAAKGAARSAGPAKAGAAKAAGAGKSAAKAGAAKLPAVGKKSARKAGPAKLPVAGKKSARKGGAAAKPAPAKNAVTKKPIAKKVIAKKVDVRPVTTKSGGVKGAAKFAPESPPKKLELKTSVEPKRGKSSGKTTEPNPAAKPKKVAAQLELADWASARPKPDSSTAARDARQLLEQRKAIKNALAPTGDGKSIVDAYMRDVDHPFKAEMEAVRQIILGVSPKLSERIKWNAPSFYYKEDLGAFNPRSSQFAHLILLFPDGGALPEKSAILEGTHKDRREVKFHSMDDVKSKQRALEKIIKGWIDYRDLR